MLLFIIAIYWLAGLLVIILSFRVNSRIMFSDSFGLSPSKFLANLRVLFIFHCVTYLFQTVRR